MMESQGLSTEGTALQGLLQQEREAMEREKGAAADIDSPDPTAELETKLDEEPQKPKQESCSLADVEGVQPTEKSLGTEVTA